MIKLAKKDLRWYLLGMATLSLFAVGAVKGQSANASNIQNSPSYQQAVKEEQSQPAQMAKPNVPKQDVARVAQEQSEAEQSVAHQNAQPSASQVSHAESATASRNYQNPANHQAVNNYAQQHHDIVYHGMVIGQANAGLGHQNAVRPAHVGVRNGWSTDSATDANTATPSSVANNTNVARQGNQASASNNTASNALNGKLPQTNEANHSASYVGGVMALLSLGLGAVGYRKRHLA